jgi:hypothetical protein
VPYRAVHNSVNGPFVSVVTLNFGYVFLLLSYNTISGTVQPSIPRQISSDKRHFYTTDFAHSSTPSCQWYVRSSTFSFSQEDPSVNLFGFNNLSCVF